MLEDTAQQMIASASFRAVVDAPTLTQPVFAVMHQRHRPSRMHRRLTRIVARQFSARTNT